jgi:molecular chaperone GrpE (heat shock protein)
LKQQIKEIEEKAESESKKPAVMGVNKKNKSMMSGNEPVNKANEDLINFLEHKLEEIEKKLQKTQSEYENLQ